MAAGAWLPVIGKQGERSPEAEPRGPAWSDRYSCNLSVAFGSTYPDQ